MTGHCAARAWLAPLAALALAPGLSGALRKTTEALYGDATSIEQSASCLPEPEEFYQSSFLQSSIAQEFRLLSDATRQEMESSFLAAYARNLSFERDCPTIKDKVSNLRPLVVPRLKLAFCFVPKTACTQFKDLINSLNGLAVKNGFGKTYFSSSPAALGVPRSQITKQNGWKFAAFTRDPALRYLSAFGSTCVSLDAESHYEHKFECCGPLVPNNTVPREGLVKAFEMRVMKDAEIGLIRNDNHWAQQVKILQHCGPNFMPDRLDFHGHLSGDVNQQVKNMLAMVGDHFDGALVDRYFPKGGIAGHRNPLHLPPAVFFRNKTVLRAVMKLYEDDYQRLPNVGCSFTRGALASNWSRRRTPSPPRSPFHTQPIRWPMARISAVAPQFRPAWPQWLGIR
mmetsp:Transcript_35728/g.83070  ORF Transcript_35728/g.83070 Transcript_35728/m.83070 type:complete len:398 (+) Transcript_35728:71-1264(+)